MPFPEVKRVLYKKNPLDQVICQLRFPPILRIDAEIPAAFQENVRRHFPKFSETSEWNVAVPQDLSGQVPPELIQQLFQPVANKNYVFSSENGEWKINLTRTFVALTAKRYERWEQFKEMLQIPFNALIKTYSPDYFSRIGLRYVDVIKRSTLGLVNAQWDELLQPYILGIFGSSDVRQQVINFESKYEIRLSDGESLVRLITSLVQAADNQEECYKIDSDFHHTQKTGINSAMERLDFFNSRSSRLIQWCITKRLHAAMEPEIL